MRALRSIVCAVDFSPVSRRALEAAIELARGGASLTLVHVEPAPPGRAAALGAPPPIAARSDPAAAATLDAWAADAEVAIGRPVSKMLLPGKPADEILRAADAGAHDLVVLGTSGRTGIARAVLGSVAEQVIRNARVPVLVVPAK